MILLVYKIRQTSLSYQVVKKKKKGCEIMNTTKKENKLMKGLKRFKWENASLLITIPFVIYALLTHLIKGIESGNLILEVYIYFGMVALIYYFLKDLRHNLKEYVNFFKEN